MFRGVSLNRPGVPNLWTTGCFKANVYTLTNDCDKYSMCSEKIMVDLLLVYPEISFDNNKSEKITEIS